MRIDPNKSIFHEDPSARTSGEFSRSELKHCRQLLRRLRFLEANVNLSGGLANGGGSGGAAFAEYEMDALEWVLAEVGFLSESRELPSAVNR